WFIGNVVLCPRCPWIGNWRSFAGRHVRLPREAPALFHLQLCNCTPLQCVGAKIVFQDGGAFLLVYVVVEGHAAASRSSSPTATANFRNCCASSLNPLVTSAITAGSCFLSQAISSSPTRVKKHLVWSSLASTILALPA